MAEQFRAAGRKGDDVTFLRVDRDFNELCLKAARNEFAEMAMMPLHSLSRRFWYVHYRQAADLAETAELHAAIAQAIALGDESAAARAADALLDSVEAFTRSTVDLDF
ncbi:MAG: hypothetical protein RLZZ153_94 [Pseudomonadota bacterium]|jgi:DNA-binding GntR family transcriptional regulator